LVIQEKSGNFAAQKKCVRHMKEILIVIGVLAVAMLLLSVRVLIKKNGRFSSQHISENKRMKQDGIHCATSQDREARRRNKNRIKTKDL